MANDFPQIEIRTRLSSGIGITEILIDGHVLKGVRSFTLAQESGNAVPTLTVDLNAVNVFVDSPMILREKKFGEMEISFKNHGTPEEVP